MQVDYGQYAQSGITTNVVSSGDPFALQGEVISSDPFSQVQVNQPIVQGTTDYAQYLSGGEVIQGATDPFAQATSYEGQVVSGDPFGGVQVNAPIVNQPIVQGTTDYAQFLQGAQVQDPLVGADAFQVSGALPATTEAYQFTQVQQTNVGPVTAQVIQQPGL